MEGQELRSYEGMFIIVPTLNEDALEKTVKGIIEVIKKHGGEIEESLRWGKRRLAYKIRKHQEGVYQLIRFRCLPSTISELRAIYKLNEDILRNLIISVNSESERKEGTQSG